MEGSAKLWAHSNPGARGRAAPASVEEGRRLFGRIDRQRGRDGLVNAHDPRVDQFGPEADCEYGRRVVRFERFLQEPVRAHKLMG